MKKKLILRIAMGFPIGISIGYLISIFISLLFNDGEYIPCHPDLVIKMGSETNAVLFQTLLSGVLGSGFSASSVIWEVEDWNLIKKTGIYFFITAFIMLPIAYFSYWMEHSIRGFLIYFGRFIVIFIIIWVLEYIIIKSSVEKMNANLHKNN